MVIVMTKQTSQIVIMTMVTAVIQIAALSGAQSVNASTKQAVW